MLEHLNFSPGALSGKVVVVAGASGGIGAACAKLVAVAGANLVIHGRNEARLIELEGLLAAGGVEPDRVARATGDLLNDQTAGTLIKAATTRWRRCDVVINATGSGRFGALTDVPLDQQLMTLGVATAGTLRLAHASVEALGRPGVNGLFVQVGSGLAHTARAKTAAYTAGQHAVRGMLQALRLEYNRRVRFALVTAGGAGVNTRFWDAAESKTDRTLMMSPERVAREVMTVVTAPPDVIIDEVRLRTL